MKPPKLQFHFSCRYSQGFIGLILCINNYSHNYISYNVYLTKQIVRNIKLPCFKMGLTNYVLSTVKILIFVVFAIIVAPGIPPHIQFKPYTIDPPLALEGNLAPNSILDKAVALKLDTAIAGPESIAIRGDEIFTGLEGGNIVRIKDGKVTPIAKFGKECEGVWDTLKCGRVAGVRFDSTGKLIAADAVYGIFRLDVDTGAFEHLVKMDVPIEGKLPTFPDDLDVGKDGSIYFSDASTVADVTNQITEILGQPTARLVKYDPITKKCTVLIDNLQFTNGVQLSHDEEFVMVAELQRSRVWRYFLKGERKGQSEIFVDHLPGLPDNIRSNGKNGYYIVLASPIRIPDKPGIIELLAPFPLVRKFAARSIYLINSFLSLVNSIVPNIYVRQLRYWVSHLGPLGDLRNQPKDVIIVEIDNNGNIIGSLHKKDGPIAHLSEISVGNEFTYFGSPSSYYVYRMKTSDLKKL